MAAGAGDGADQGPPSPEAPGAAGRGGPPDWAGARPGPALAAVAGKVAVAEARRGHGPTLGPTLTCKGWKEVLKRDATAAAGGPEVWRDWGNRCGEGLPAEVLATVAEKLVAQAEAAREAQLKERGHSEEYIQGLMEERKRKGNCLFVFARVCREWRKAQLKVGGPLRTRVHSDVLLPGRVALAKWALAEGCPREDGYSNMAHAAASLGHAELVKWLCGEGGFKMDWIVMRGAARSGNLELVRWLRGEGCPWDHWTCYQAVHNGHVEVLRWARENGCRWAEWTRDLAAGKLGYTDDFGNLVGEGLGLS